MQNSVIEYGETLKKIGGGLVQVSKGLRFIDTEDVLIKLELEVSLLEKSITDLELVSPPKIIEKEHLELISVFKDLTEGMKYLIQYIKSNADIMNSNKFSNMLKDINNRGNNIINILSSIILKLVIAQ
ncbi:hypothetical protein ACXM0N_14415 [Peribacillus simplex]